MFNQSQKDKIIFNHAEKSLNQQISSSSLKFYNDGIGFNGYSIRLSNMSLHNLTNNLARFVGCSLGVGLVMGDMIGLLANNDRTHYSISHDFRGMGTPLAPFNCNALIEAISKSDCNVTYDQIRQAEYDDLPWKHIYSIENSEIRFSLSLHLQRGVLEPILQSYEECLIGLMNTAYSIWEKSAAEQQLKNDIAADLFMKDAEFYLCAGLGLFAGGYAAYRIYDDWNKRNRPLSFDERLKKINYNGEIDDEFICIINKTLMNDPVICNDGYVYDRSAIEKWLQYKESSPIKPNVSISSINPHARLRDKIEEFVCDLEHQYRNRALLS